MDRKDMNKKGNKYTSVSNMLQPCEMALVRRCPNVGLFYPHVFIETTGCFKIKHRTIFLISRVSMKKNGFN